MSLLNLSQQLSLSPKRVASTNGGEYHSPCPGCGGKDRFIIWEQEGRYYCRQCNAAGDTIQFCRDFMGMDFRSACHKLGIEKTRSLSHYSKREFVPSVATLSSEVWQKRAIQFVRYCHKNLIQHSQGIDFLHQRGLSAAEF